MRTGSAARAVIVLLLAGCGGSGAAGPATSTTAASASATSTTSTSSTGLSALHIDGNRMVDGSGATVRLFGINKSGTEDACGDGGGYAVFDGPSDQASVTAMRTWHMNAVRVPLNEQCWLAVHGTKPAYSGSAYRRAIAGYVDLLNRNGLYAILDLHVASASATLVTPRQTPFPDVVHSVSFWASVAATFRAQPGVLLDLYNEPYGGSWACWRKGCRLTSPHDNRGQALPPYQAAGMQQLIDAIRGAGAKQVVLAGGLDYANDLTGWLANRPTDPTGNLAVGFHVYPNAACTPSSCDGGVPVCRPADCAGGPGVLGKVAAQVPVVVGEVGEYDCGHRYVDGLYAYFDKIGASYLGWTWNAGGSWTCKDGPTLISSYRGTPTPYGIALRDHLRRAW